MTRDYANTIGATGYADNAVEAVSLCKELVATVKITETQAVYAVRSLASARLAAISSTRGDISKAGFAFVYKCRGQAATPISSECGDYQIYLRWRFR